MIRILTSILCLALSLSLLACGGESETSSSGSTDGTVTAEPIVETVALPEFTPLEIPDGFLPLTPRTQTEEEIDALIAEQVKFEQAGGGYREVYVRIVYGPELNLNPGPPGMRPTSEGGDLLIEGTVHLKDGSTIPAGPPSGSSQTWRPDKGTFLDSRSLKIEDEAKTRDIDKITGKVTFIFPVGTQAIELTADSPPTTEIADGLQVSPNWDGHSLSVEYEAGCYRKIVHLVGIDAEGNELMITSMGGQQREDHPDAGLCSFFFADTAPLARIHFYAAPRFVERVVPFEVKPPQ